MGRVVSCATPPLPVHHLVWWFGKKTPLWQWQGKICLQTMCKASRGKGIEWAEYFSFLGKGGDLSEQAQAQRNKLEVCKGATFKHWEKERHCRTIVVTSHRPQKESSVNISPVHTQGKDDPVIWAHSGDDEFILPSPSKPYSSLALPSLQRNWEGRSEPQPVISPLHHPPNRSRCLCCRISPLGRCYMTDRRTIHMPVAIPSADSEGKETPSFAFQMELSWSGSHWERINMENDHLSFPHSHCYWTTAINLKTIISNLHKSIMASAAAGATSSEFFHIS